MTTLVRRLRYAEGIGTNPDIDPAIEFATARYGGQTGIQQLKLPPDQIPTDLVDTQREIIGGYRSNPLIERAIFGKETIESAYKRLKAVYGGWRGVIPRRLNEAHNKEVEALESLVGGAGVNRAGGLIAPDNFTTIAIGTAVLTYVGGAALLSLILDPDRYETLQDLQKTVRDFKLIPPVIGTLIGLIAGVISTSLVDDKTQQVQYLDQKIQEIYLPHLRNH